MMSRLELSMMRRREKMRLKVIPSLLAHGEQLEAFYDEGRRGYALESGSFMAFGEKCRKLFRQILWVFCFPEKGFIPTYELLFDIRRRDSLGYN